jgi:hypothetical protein
MTMTSSVMSTFAIPVASLLRTSLVLMAASLGCLRRDPRASTAALH